ncbi:carboxypeptidase-like regulatory domain-containing protein [Desulfonema ishimotonii]|uniref:carboxypeptidase-like regulatory domain-containing protein n=1 Tax=Desulfonema ishimotonii TaxID=45657 RepID=UPI000F5762D5|nr:carboxypeptidase-like regulatory domain-containing protein [Desulfonema ishimotonii]
MDIAAVVFVFISLITSLFCGSVLGIFYWDGPYLGRVVDADSGAPVAEASVVAIWSVEYINSPWTGGTSFADAREAVTDENGRFILPIGRTFWLWPFSRIMINGISVFKSGYDSYPPHMQYSWNKDDMKIWQKKLNRLYPKHQGNIRERYEEIFTHNYLPARFEPYTIRLNQARSLREQLRVVRSCEINGFTFHIRNDEINGCNSHVRKRKNMVYEEKKKLKSITD